MDWTQRLLQSCSRLLLTLTFTALATTATAGSLNATGVWGLAPVGHAPTPPMGWNSWNAFGVSGNEAKVMGAARAIVADGLAKAGYRYVDIADQTSFRPFTDKLHAMGLEAGIYTLRMRGERAVALFNRTSAPAKILLNAEHPKMARDEPIAVRDLWARRDLGRFVGSRVFTDQPHEMLMLKVTGTPFLAGGYYLSEMTGRINALGNSRLQVKADREFTRLTALVGIDDTTHGRAAPVRFEVYGDGKLLAASRPMHFNEAAESLQANVAGMSVVELVARQIGTDQGAVVSPGPTRRWSNS